jgi:glutamate decarboxylase
MVRKPYHIHLSRCLIKIRNFELPRVKSINASGHKYGLTYAGVGWIIWRDESFLPEHLIFELHYLGGTEKSFTLNFSRPGAQVIGQYYNLIHLGFAGYREIMENCLSNARLLAKSLEATGWYTVVSDIHRRISSTEDSTTAASSVVGTVKSAATRVAGTIGGENAAGAIAEETSANYVAGLPVVSFRLTEEFKKEFPLVQQETVSVLLRSKGWIIPNYALPPNEDKTEILRVVIRESMSFDLLDRLISDICEVTQTLLENDQIDLSVLQKQKRKVELKGDKEKRASEAALRKEVGKQATKMADGIHRSVC